MNVFNGTQYAKLLDDQLASYLTTPQGKKKLNKHLAVIQVGENDISAKYILMKQKLCSGFGIPMRVFNLAEAVPMAQLKAQVAAIADDPKCGGVLVQLPLPAPKYTCILELIPKTKDVDVLTLANREAFFNQQNLIFKPPIIRALDCFLKYSNLQLPNLRVTLIGEGFLVGLPIHRYLTHHKAKVTVLTEVNPKVKSPKIEADLLVLAAGVPNMIRGEWLSADCCVVDFGTTLVSGRVTGDLDRNSKLDHLRSVALSPGGMGPLVVRFLVMNFLGL